MVDPRTKLPRAIRMLAQFGARAMQRSHVDGKYIAPKVSRRIASVVRKEAIINGTYGSFSPEVGGWDPSWDTPRKIVTLRPHRGHKRDRTRPERAAKITKAMEGMPAREQKYRQEAQDRKPVKGLRYFVKRIEAQARKDAKDFERGP
mmetsp:Transcript_2965/g.5400  ORF Transcript_2965/g.5400 Transcript_2965/m.5400 type:complete len:147 (+) Transcript_2965:65-505(+)